MRATKNKPGYPAHKLTRKQKAFADKIINEPKISATQAVIQAYGKPTKPVTYGSARMMAAENLAKPNILKYLHAHAVIAESKVIEAMDATQKVYMKGTPIDEIPDNAIRLQAANSILDRVHGKATQRVESTNTSVSIKLDLTT